MKSKPEKKLSSNDILNNHLEQVQKDLNYEEKKKINNGRVFDFDILSDLQEEIKKDIITLPDGKKIDINNLAFNKQELRIILSGLDWSVPYYKDTIEKVKEKINIILYFIQREEITKKKTEYPLTAEQCFK